MLDWRGVSCSPGRPGSTASGSGNSSMALYVSWQIILWQLSICILVFLLYSPCFYLSWTRLQFPFFFRCAKVIWSMATRRIRNYFFLFSLTYFSLIFLPSFARIFFFFVSARTQPFNDCAPTLGLRLSYWHWNCKNNFPYAPLNGRGLKHKHQRWHQGQKGQELCYCSPDYFCGFFVFAGFFSNFYVTRSFESFCQEQAEFKVLSKCALNLYRCTHVCRDLWSVSVPLRPLFIRWSQQIRIERWGLVITYALWQPTSLGLISRFANRIQLALCALLIWFWTSRTAQYAAF